MGVRVHAELRVRDGKTVGVIWPLNEHGVSDADGTRQGEWELGEVGADGQPKLGDRLCFNLMIMELCNQPGWALADVAREEK